LMSSEGDITEGGGFHDGFGGELHALIDVCVSCCE
jgi:hypothetical protein